MRESMDRESQFLSRFGAAANHLGLGGSGLYGHGAPPSYGLPGLPPDRYRDGLSMPPHLGHPMAGSLGLSLAGQQSASLNDRYGPIPGMSGAPTLYPPTSASYPFAPLGPGGLLGSGLGSSMGSLSMLPQSLMTPGGKRTPPPLSSGQPPTSLQPGSSALASLGRTHMGLMPSGLGLPPYPMPSPSPMMNPHHLLPPLGPSMGGARPPSNSTPPSGRPLMDLTSPHPPSGLAPFNPLDPYPRKEDPQSR